MTEIFIFEIVLFIVLLILAIACTVYQFKKRDKAIEKFIALGGTKEEVDEIKEKIRREVAIESNSEQIASATRKIYYEK